MWVLPTPNGLAECWALDAYTRPPDGLTRAADLFTKAKYHRLGPPLMVLCRMFAEAAASVARFRRWPRDVVVIPVASSSPLPLELARAAASALDAPLLQVFRPPAGPKLKNISPGARAARASGRAVVDPHIASPKHVVLVDDVVETGAMISASAHALRDIGAEFVVALTAVQIHR